MALFYYTGITIGFEYETYAFREDRAHLLVQDEVFIIKQNNQMSELTYNITIDFFSGSAIICGSCDVQSLAKHHEVITPMQQRIPVNFRIFPDDVPEGIETFTVQIRNNDPATNFTNYPGEATISIFDDYGRYHKLVCMIFRCEFCSHVARNRGCSVLVDPSHYETSHIAWSEGKRWSV